MSITVDLLGVSHEIPETGERNWGPDVTAYLVAVGAALDALASAVGSTFGPRLPTSSSTLLASATLTPASPGVYVTGSPGAVTIGSIADGESDGQLLLLVGSSDTNTVTIPDAANTALNGPCTLGLNDSLFLFWSESRSLWIEMSRSE